MSQRRHRRSKRCFYEHSSIVPNEIHGRNPEWTHKASVELKTVQYLNKMGIRSISTVIKVKHFLCTFEHHFCVCCFMFDQEDFAEPTLTNDLKDVEFVHQMYLKNEF